MVSKVFDKPKKISSIFCFKLKKEVISLVSSVHARLMECDFLQPNRQFERIFILLQKKYKRLCCSKVNENFSAKSPRISELSINGI